MGVSTDLNLSQSLGLRPLDLLPPNHRPKYSSNVTGIPAGRKMTRHEPLVK
jgi:hypothetical protein